MVDEVSNVDDKDMKIIADRCISRQQSAIFYVFFRETKKLASHRLDLFSAPSPKYGALQILRNQQTIC
jgi:hypothetical protein